MGSCESMAALILRSVDGTLDPAGEERLAAHLAGCPSCRAARAGQAAVKKVLADLPLATVGPDFAARVRARVAPAPWLDLANWRTWTLRLLPVAAVLALLAVLPTSGTTSADVTDATPTFSSAMDSWTTARVGADAAAGSAASTHMQLLLNADTDPNALVAAAIGGGTP